MPLEPNNMILIIEATILTYGRDSGFTNWKKVGGSRGKNMNQV